MQTETSSLHKNVWQLHGTFKLKMMLMHFNMSLITQHHFMNPWLIDFCWSFNSWSSSWWLLSVLLTQLYSTTLDVSLIWWWESLFACSTSLSSMPRVSATRVARSGILLITLLITVLKSFSLSRSTSLGQIYHKTSNWSVWFLRLIYIRSNERVIKIPVLLNQWKPRVI